MHTICTQCIVSVAVTHVIDGQSVGEWSSIGGRAVDGQQARMQGPNHGVLHARSVCQIGIGSVHPRMMRACNFQNTHAMKIRKTASSAVETSCHQDLHYTLILYSIFL